MNLEKRIKKFEDSRRKTDLKLFKALIKYFKRRQSLSVKIMGKKNK